MSNVVLWPRGHFRWINYPQLTAWHSLIHILYIAFVIIGSILKFYKNRTINLPDRLIGLSNRLFVMIHSTTIKSLARLLEHVLMLRIVVDFVYRIRLPLFFFWFHIYMKPLYNVKGNILGLYRAPSA